MSGTGSNSNSLSDSIKLFEYSSLKVPYEMLNRQYRSAQRIIERDSSTVERSVDDLIAHLNKRAPISLLESSVDALCKRVSGLNDRSREALDEDLRAVQVIGDRVAYLKSYAAAFGSLPRAVEPMDTDSTPPAPPSPSLPASSSPPYATPAARTPEDRAPASPVGTNASATREREPDRVKFLRVRTDRLVIDYLLRAGLYETADALARAAPHIEHTNLDMLQSLHDVENALQTRDLSKCLAWCHENRSKLKKNRSTLELNVRLQEFICLVQEGKRTEALRYARRHLVPVAHDESLLPQSVPGAGSGLFLPLLPPYSSERYYATGAASAGSARFSMTPTFTATPLPSRQSASALTSSAAGHPLTVSLGSAAASSAAGQPAGAASRELTDAAAMMELTGLRVRDVLRELSAIGSSGAATTRMLHVAYNRLLGASSSSGASAAVGSAFEAGAREGTPAAGGGADAGGVAQSLAPLVGPGLGLNWSRDLVLRLITLVVMDPNTELQPYKELLSARRWQALSTELRMEVARLYQLPDQPVLLACIQAALAALKTWECEREPTRCGQCPVCSSAAARELARTVPQSQHTQSRIICRMSARPLTDDDPPYMLPNGYVYSRSSLEAQAMKNADGYVHCVRTGARFLLTDAKRVYIM